jgi:ubiquinone/menaquinone biosynthesis C-methylase UbiE
MSNYFNTRFLEDQRRAKSWGYLCKYFQKQIGKNETILEIGAGYCYFINQIAGTKKIAVDIFPDLHLFANKSVEAHIGDATKMQFLSDSSIDTVFASNFFEHLEWTQLESLMTELIRVLKPTGKVLIMQPNFRYAYKNYFDDYTHRTIFTDRSISDWFSTKGFEVEISKPRFLPLTVKSSMGHLSFLIPLYLLSPWKPRAGQMFLVFRRTT